MKHYHTSALAAIGLFLAHLLPAVGIVFLWVTAHSPYVQGFTLLCAALYQILLLLLLLPRIWARIKRWTRRS